MPLRQVSVALLAQGLGEGLKMKGYKFKVWGVGVGLTVPGSEDPSLKLWEPPDFGNSYVRKEPKVITRGLGV